MSFCLRWRFVQYRCQRPSALAVLMMVQQAHDIFCRVFDVYVAGLIPKNQSEHHAGASLDLSVNKWKWGNTVFSCWVTWWYTVKVWPFPELILIRGFRQIERFNSLVPHPPFIHTLCHLSNGSMLTFPWETSTLSAAICLIVGARVRRGREWEKREDYTVCDIISSKLV